MKDVLTADGKTVVFIISFMNINFFILISFLPIVLHIDF